MARCSATTVGRRSVRSRSPAGQGYSEQRIAAGIAEKEVADATLFEQVVAHRQVFFRQNWVDYATMKRGTVDVAPQPEQLDDWRADYAAMQGDMFLTPPPPFDDVLAAIAKFQSRFNAP